MNLFLDFFQEQRIRETQKRADYAAEKATGAVDSSKDLRSRVEGLALANQALFELLQSRFGISEADVLERMAQIDSRDGARDGKMSPQITACPKCGRRVSTSRQRCMFCGGPIIDGHIFEKA